MLEWVAPGGRRSCGGSARSRPDPGATTTFRGEPLKVLVAGVDRRPVASRYARHGGRDRPSRRARREPGRAGSGWWRSRLPVASAWRPRHGRGAHGSPRTSASDESTAHADRALGRARGDPPGDRRARVFEPRGAGRSSGAPGWTSGIGRSPRSSRTGRCAAASPSIRDRSSRQRPIGRMTSGVRNALRLGAYQIAFTSVAGPRGRRRDGGARRSRGSGAS